MFYKESKNFLTKENIDFIENVILGNNFPFYLSKQSTLKDNYKNMFHNLLHRPEGIYPNGRINSIHYDNVFSLVNSFFKKFNIKHKEILRMCINFTYNNGVKKCPIHEDHDFPHKQLIIYLNDADPNSKTIILNKKNKIIKEIKPEKYKGICFETLPHYMFYPKKNERIILVTTFK
jgi:hypothetical protein